MGKRRIEASLHVTGDLVHLKVKDIKTIEELPKLTKNPWQKKETRWLLTVKFRQPSHEFTFSVGMSFISYPLVLTPLI
jgi:hypothetical protein